MLSFRLYQNQKDLIYPQGAIDKTLHRSYNSTEHVHVFVHVGLKEMHQCAMGGVRWDRRHTEFNNNKECSSDTCGFKKRDV